MLYVSSKSADIYFANCKCCPFLQGIHQIPPFRGLPPSTTHHLGPLPTTCLLPPVTHFLRPPLLLSHLLLPHAHHLEVSITLQELLHPHLLQGQKQHRQLQHGWMSKALTSGKFFKL